MILDSEMFENHFLNALQTILPVLETKQPDVRDCLYYNIFILYFYTNAIFNRDYIFIHYYKYWSQLANIF